MKGVLIGAGVALALLGAGAAWTLRRQPGSGNLLEAQDNGFSMQPSGLGKRLQLQDARSPLRALRWLPPMAGGMLAAQLLGQNDRQRVALFRDGTPVATVLVLKPAGVADGFWRFAELRAAAMAPGGSLILLYRAGDPASPELPLLLALDPASQQVQWTFRGAGIQLAVTEGPDPGVYLYGGSSPIQRLALTPAGPGAQHPAVKQIELPPELKEVDCLLPTGAWAFLVSHRDGLSAYRPGSGWTHFPAPEDRGQACLDWHSTLVRNGHDIWWQAVPGQLTRVRADGQPGQPWPGTLPAGDPFARDARLWRALGADPSGSIWFALATPVLPPTPAPEAAAMPAPGATAAPAQPPGPATAAPAQPPGPAAAGPQVSPAPAPPDLAADWGPYLAQGLDRVYRWDPQARTLARVSLGAAWAGLNPPPAIPAPQPAALVPAAGAILAESPGCAWWLPLDALPMVPVAGSVSR